MVDTRIAMAGTPLDTATGVQAANQQQNQNALSTEQVLKQHYENLDTREKSRLSSTVAGAAQLKTYLDNNDLDGAHEFLMKRKESLQSRVANGEQVDTQETDYALDALRTGKVDQLKNDVGGIIAAGQVYGILSNKDMPSNVQEWQYYNQLPQGDKDKYLQMKRANQVANLGGTTIIVGPDGKPKETYEHTLKPEDVPQNAFNKSQADAQGKSAGSADNAEVRQGAKQVTDILNTMKSKYTELDQKGGIVNTDKSTGYNISASLGASDTGQSIAAKAGGKEQSIRNQIKNEKPMLISAIRTASGMTASAMNSDSELQFYLQQIGNEKLDLQTNIEAINALEKKYGLSKFGNAVAPQSTQTTQQPQQGGGKVTISNGKETYQIDAADLPAAQQEGFSPIQ